MVIKNVYKDRRDWLEYRNSDFVVGGSNIGTILGLNKHQTPLQYWTALKTENLKQNTHTDAMFRGQFMEDGIARWFEKETGHKIIKRSAEISVFRNSKYPAYIQVAPDRELFANGSGNRPILEIKDTRLIIDFDDISTIPDEWFAQIQLQMAIMERTEGFLAVNDGNKSMKYRLIKFDAKYAEEIIAQAVEWVELYILGDKQPPPINGDDVELIHPISTEGIIRVNESTYNIFKQMEVLKKSIKDLQNKYDTLKNDLESNFDERDTLSFEGHNFASYKTVKTNRFDSTKFRTDYPQLYAEYLSDSSYRKLMLK